MDVHAVADVRDFLREAEPVLLRDEARHNLILGIAGTLVDQPELYPEHHLWVVRSSGEAVGAALRTPPFNLVLADPLVPGVLEDLVGALTGAGMDLPGVVANRPHAEEFARRWVEASRARAIPRMEQGVYALEGVRDVPGAAGEPRVATEADRAVLLDWLRAFQAEALPPRSPAEDQTERMLDVRLSGTEDAGFWIWEDREPVSVTGFGGRTPNGIRIGPVFTPQDRRGRGYATALVAAVSARQLARGRRFCFLYTDLANPTSNAIYERIGYERVCEAAEIGFEPAG
jgi:uncharacterized protein